MEQFRKGIASCLDTEVVESLISIILQLPADPAGGRKGGFFSVYDTESMSMITKSFGDFPKEKAGQYFRNSTEKVTRLVKNPEHYRSFQSRDEAKEWWGGGVHYGDLYCAFSGFPEKLDEALSLIYAMYVNHCKYWDSKEFKNAVLYEQKAKYKDNEFISLVLEVFVNDSNFEKKLDPLRVSARVKLEKLAEYIRTIPVIYEVTICDIEEDGDILNISVVPNLISFIKGCDPDASMPLFCLTKDHTVTAFSVTEMEHDTDHIFGEHCGDENYEKNYENISDFCKAMIELGKKYEDAVPQVSEIPQ